MDITIARISPEHGPQVRTLIAHAFADDPLINWLFPPADMSRDQRLDAIAILYWPNVETYTASGTGHVALDSHQVVGASLWSVPNVPRPAPASPSSTAVAKMVLGEKFDELSSAMQNARAMGEPPSTPYLHDLAVDDHLRSSGVGAKLLEAGLDEFGAGGCWLETTNPRNHSFYDRFGFNAVGSHQFADSAVSMTRMVRA
jgi:GNAT superfamily N-acetyltransferase